MIYTRIYTGDQREILSFCNKLVKIRNLYTRIKRTFADFEKMTISPTDINILFDTSTSRTPK